MGLLKKVERELLFRKNLKLFEEKLPPVAEVIKKVKTPIKIKEEGGKLDALVGGVSVYGGDAFALVQKQIELFERAEPKIFRSVSVEIPTREDLIITKYAQKIAKLAGNQVNFTAPKLTKGIIPLLIVVGVGFGIHIEELLKRYKIQNLILVDTPTYFKLSFYYLDWGKVFEYFSPETKRQIHIVIKDNKYAHKHPDEAYSSILEAVKELNPSIAFYGYYFQHLSYEPPMTPVNWLKEYPTLKFLLYGYFDDELWALDWTIEKALRGIPVYYGDVKVPKGSVAFVLGAGPSLDKTLELVERYKDNAVIVSCGSTITSLEKVGLKPDIHVELERTKYTYDVLSEVNPEFLKNIFLITVNAVWTDCFELFNEGGFILKLNDTGARIFSSLNIPELANIGPTVTAMGVSLCASLGFEEVYLFGVDLGSKEANLHHSKLSNYYNSKSMLNKVKPVFDRQVPGNFGGVVYTEMLFQDTAYAIHKVIHQTGLRVYNLSDGIRIPDAIPLDPEDFYLDKNIKKEEVLRRVKENFRRDYTNVINPKDILENLYRTLKSLEILIRSIEKPRDIAEALHVMTQIEKYINNIGAIGYNMLYPNTYQWGLLVVGYILNTEPEKVPDFMKHFLELYTDFVKDAYGAIENLLRKHYST